MTTTSTSSPAFSSSGSETCPTLCWRLSCTKSLYGPWVCGHNYISCFIAFDTGVLNPLMILWQFNQQHTLVCLPRFAGQKGNDQRSVFSDWPAKQNAPKHPGASRISSCQVILKKMLSYSVTAGLNMGLFLFLWWTTNFEPMFLGSPCKRRQTACQLTPWP